MNENMNRENYDYENEQYAEQNMEQPAEKRTGRGKKQSARKHDMMKKTAYIVALALVFGTVSGGAFSAVTNVATAAAVQSSAEATQKVSTTVAKMTSGGDTAASSTDSDASTASTGEMSVKEVAKAVLPATVAINCTGTTTVNTMWGNAQQEYSSCGTGIIVGQNDEELLIATNNHVVEDSTTVSVSFTNDAEAEAQIKGTDSDNDLAVVAVKLSDIDEETMSAIAIAELGDSDDLEVGEQVVAIGNALGYGQSVTTGIISALNREVTTEESTNELIQTDAAINPGNSGGALVNMKGQVIGINSAKLASDEVEGMGYAIPVSLASPILDELMNRETRTEVSEDQSSYLGIQGQDISSDIASAYNMPQGIYVSSLEENSPAATAGMLSGDIIVSFDGTTVKSMEALQKQMKYYASGETVNITVKRVTNGSYEEKELTVTLGHRDSSTANSGGQTSEGADGSEGYSYNYGYGSQSGDVYGSQNGSLYGGQGSYGSFFGSGY